MRNTLLTTAAALALAFAVPAMAQTARDPLPANPSAVQDGTPAAGTDTGKAPGVDPAARTNVPGAMNGTTPTENSTSAPGVVQSPPPGQSGMVGSAQPGGSDAGAGTTGAGSVGTGSVGGQTAQDQSGSASGNSGLHNNMMRRTHHTAMGLAGNGHWAHQPGTGESGPASDRASNIDAADTHSAIAPHFPQPAVGQNATPSRYLQDAENALKRHRTGEADQALEMAETRLLDRSTPATDASQPDQNPAIAQVSTARKALASGDMKAARAAIETALASTGGGEGGGMSGGSMGGSTSMGGMHSQGAAGVGSLNQGSNVAPASPEPAGAGAAGAAPAVSGGTGGGPAGTPSNDSAGGAK
jgi:hypothetical protein